MLQQNKARGLLPLINSEMWTKFEDDLRDKKTTSERRLMTEDKEIEIFRLQGRIKLIQELLDYKVNTNRDAKHDG